MNIKLFLCILLIALVLSCGNSGKKTGSNQWGDTSTNVNSSHARTITLKESHVRSYIKVTNELYKMSPELVEKVQAQVPMDMSGYTGMITNSGFKNIQEFQNTSLVISICMNTIIQAEYMDDIQGKTKEDYIAEFTEGLDDEDEFDRRFKEEMEKQMEDTLSELESEGLIGQNTNSTGTFIRLLKEKVGEKNTELVLRYREELKDIWVLKYK